MGHSLLAVTAPYKRIHGTTYEKEDGSIDFTRSKEWGFGRVKGRTLNMSLVYQSIKLLEFVESKIHHHLALQEDGSFKETHRISIRNQTTMHIWLEEIRAKLKKVMDRSEKATRSKQRI